MPGDLARVDNTYSDKPMGKFSMRQLHMFLGMAAARGIAKAEAAIRLARTACMIASIDSSVSLKLVFGTASLCQIHSQFMSPLN